MAVVDSILVNAKLSVQSEYRDVDSTPMYIVRDHVQYYYKHVDNKGNVSEILTTVIFNSVTPLSGPQAGGPDLTPIPVDAPLGLSVTIISPLADFHTLMTT